MDTTGSVPDASAGNVYANLLAGTGNTYDAPLAVNVRPHSAGPLNMNPRDYTFVGRMGPVASLVQGFNLGNPLPAIPNFAARDSSARRHGTAEHGSDLRTRERSPRPRTPRSTSRSAQDVQDRAAERQRAVADLGPENRSDFDIIIGNIHERLDTIERYSRLHAGHIASSDAKISALGDDIDAYKLFITSTHQNIDAFMEGRFKKIEQAHELLIAQLESLASITAPRVEQLDQRIQVLEHMSSNPNFQTSAPPGVGGFPAPAPAAGAAPPYLQSIGLVQAPAVAKTSGTAGAEHHQIHTEPRYVTEDPWASAARDRFANQYSTQAAPVQNAPPVEAPPTHAPPPAGGPCPSTVPMWSPPQNAPETG